MPIWGATPAEWAHFSDRLSLTADLLPVVSRPDAVISPTSSLKALGKTPSQYNPGGLVVGIPRWTQHVAEPHHVAQWARQPDYGICIQTRAVRAFDIDVADPKAAQALEDTIIDVLGITLPVRERSNSGKRLLAFLAPGDMAKRFMKVDGGVIEFLATGQQFIAIGMHPSGQPYRWRGGLPKAVPLLTQDQIEAVWDTLALTAAVEPPKAAGLTRERLGETMEADDVSAWLIDNWDVFDIGKQGQVFIRCPFEAEHTEPHAPGGDSSTAYFPAGNGFEQGHFKCLHAHCAHRDDGDFRDALGYGHDDFDPLPEVDTPGDPYAPRLPPDIDPAALPPRQWLYGQHLIRRFVSITVAPGGVGKSALTMVEALALATGRDLLGQKIHHGSKKVWLWNLEDPLEEMTRRLYAAMEYYGIRYADIKDRLYMNSGRDHPLLIARMERNGAVINRPCVEALIEQARKHGIDVMQIDPFISSHNLPENDNTAIDLAAKAWGNVADRANCGIDLIHHTRKNGGEETTAESSRGAKALIDAARSVRVLNRMTEKEGAMADVATHRQYFRVTNDKLNLAPPPSKAEWYHITNYSLANGDNVGVVMPWAWPDGFEGVGPEEESRIVTLAATSNWRADPQSPEWLGYAVAQDLGFDLTKPGAKYRMTELLQKLITTGHLVKVTAKDKWGKPRPCLTAFVTSNGDVPKGAEVP